MKVLKKFTFENIELRIVKREETYLNSGETVNVTRVLAPNGGAVPLVLKYKQTLKSIVSDTEEFLLGMRTNGVDVGKELTRKILLPFACE